MRWDRAARGTTPWALPLKVGSHSVFGMASLRAAGVAEVAAPARQRFAQEQTMIERWLGAVVDGTRTIGAWATRSRCAAA